MLDEGRVQGDAGNSGNVAWYVRGWAIDRDTTEAVNVVVVVYQAGHPPWWPLTYPGSPAPASLPRDDVEASLSDQRARWTGAGNPCGFDSG
jgi:hypothetical protein